MSNVKPISVRDLIQSLGGPTTVAKRLGYSVQRVSNWSSRNAVPAHVCLDHPDIFAASARRSAYAARRSRDKCAPRISGIEGGGSPKPVISGAGSPLEA